MPRPNQPRSVHSETNLARRVARERERLGMTYEGLADRMTKAGCAIQPSAIYKIEKSNPPRRISVDELVAFSTVFDIPVDQLLMPAELVDQEVLVDLLAEWLTWDSKATEAQQAEEEALARLKQHLHDRPDLLPKMQTWVRNWVDTWADAETDREFSVAHWMHKLTGSREWAKKLKTEIDRVDAARSSRKKQASRG